MGSGDESPREMKSTYASSEVVSSGTIERVKIERARSSGTIENLRFVLALLAPKHCHGVDARRPSNGHIGRERRSSNEQQRRTDHAWQIERIDTEQHAANERTSGCCSSETD